MNRVLNDKQILRMALKVLKKRGAAYRCSSYRILCFSCNMNRTYEGLKSYIEDCLEEDKRLVKSAKELEKFLKGKPSKKKGV